MNFNIYFFIDVSLILSIIDSNRNFDHIIQRFEFIYRDYHILNFIVQSFIKMRREDNVILIHFIR